MKDPPGNVTIHILTASMSIPWLYYGFPWWYHWGKQGKRPTGSLCIISYDYKIKSLLKKWKYNKMWFSIKKQTDQRPEQE